MKALSLCLLLLTCLVPACNTSPHSDHNKVLEKKDPKTDTVEDIKDAWVAVLPDLQKKAKTQMVIPMWGVDGTVLQFINSELDLSDKEALDKFVDKVVVDLRRETTMFDDPFKVSFIRGDGKTQTSGQELASYNIPAK